MKDKQILYDRLAAGERLRSQRLLLGYTQDTISEKIDRVPKYYADIERGTCGMSVETLLMLSRELQLTTDYILLGQKNEDLASSYSSEALTILAIVNSLPEEQQKNLLRMITIFKDTQKFPKM